MATSFRSNAPDRRLQLAMLRREYDAAFRELIEQTRRCREMAQKSSTDGIREACMEMQAAAAEVRDRRDALAAFLMTPPQAPSRDAMVKEAAYYRWLNAGRPDGTSASDWVAAQQQVESEPQETAV